MRKYRRNTLNISVRFDSPIHYWRGYKAPFLLYWKSGSWLKKVLIDNDLWELYRLFQVLQRRANASKCEQEYNTHVIHKSINVIQ